MQDFLTTIGHLAAIVTVAAFLLTFFFGLPGFNVPRFLAAKVSQERQPDLRNDIHPEAVEKQNVQSSQYLKYSVSEVVVLSIEDRPILKQNMSEAIWLFGPSVLAVVLTLLPVSTIISSTLLLISILWIVFLFSQLIPLASVRTPTEILFTDDKVEIISPVPINDELKNRIEVSRKSVRFGVGVVPGKIFGFTPRVKKLDWLTLYFQTDEDYANLIMVPRWYANYRKYPPLRLFAVSLNKITENSGKP